MLKGLTLTEMATCIENNKPLKKDYIASTAELEMEAADIGANGMLMNIDGHGSYPIGDIAHKQIADRIGIPAKYYDRMRETQPKLLADNVNTWFQAEPERRMVRTLADRMRSFNSDRYQRIENEEVAEAVLPVLLNRDDINIVSCQVTEKRMYIHAVATTVQGEVKKGDVVQAGVIASNSEIGMGSVSIAAMGWRLICLNGMKREEQFRKYHVGRQIEDNEALWADDTRKADDKAVLLKVRDMVSAALDEIRFKVFIEKLQGLTEGKITGSVEKAVEVLSAKVGASEREKQGLLRSLIDGGDLSRWGIVNAVTAQAHTATSYDRAVEFEAEGGKLVDLPTSEWKQILEAA